MAKKKVKKTTKKATAKKVVKKKKTAKAAKKSVTKKKAVKKISSKAKTAKASKKKKVTQKKASKKKTTPKRTLRKKVRKKRTSTLTASELQRYRQLLIERLKEILGSVSHIESGALKTSRQDSAGDLSSMPIHMAELGSENYEQELMLSVMETEESMLAQIDAALKRIDQGDYGKCMQCGGRIPKRRLDAIPYTSVCVKCAENKQAS